MFSTGWDVDRYRSEHESDEHWQLRRQFMVAHKDKYPEDRLVCLTQVFFNMEFLGCRYPRKTMELVSRLAKEVAEEFRESRKGRLKRTFVGAQDAAEAKATGSKRPPGTLAGSGSNQLDNMNQAKKPKLEVRAGSKPDVVVLDDDDPKPVSDFRGSKRPPGTWAGSVSNQPYNMNQAKKPKLEEGAGSESDVIILDDDDDCKAVADSRGSKRPPGTLAGSGSNQPDYVNQGKKPKLAVEAGNESDVIILDDDVDRKPVADLKDVTADAKEVGKSFVLMIPTRSNSMTEQDPVKIMHCNFPGNQMSFKFIGSKQEGGWTCEVWVNPTARSNVKPSLCVASTFATTQRDGKYQAATNAIATLKRFCTYLEPNPAWFKEGGTPEFIEKRVPCNKTPRTYLIMTKNYTGHINPQVADMLMTNFDQSSNDDMFFIDTEYNGQEKTHLLNSCQKFKLGFRHFSSMKNVKKMKFHHICISKVKPATEILEEARKCNWKHPKYLVTLKKP